MPKTRQIQHVVRVSNTFPTRESLRSRLHDPGRGEDFIGEAQACVVGVGFNEGVEEGDGVFDRAGEGGGGVLGGCCCHYLRGGRGLVKELFGAVSFT